MNTIFKTSLRKLSTNGVLYHDSPRPRLDSVHLHVSSVTPVVLLDVDQQHDAHQTHTAQLCVCVWGGGGGGVRVRVRGVRGAVWDIVMVKARQ